MVKETVTKFQDSARIKHAATILVRIACFLILSLGLLPLAFADRWVTPRTTPYYSFDGAFRFTVVPRVNIGDAPCIGRLERPVLLGLFHSTIWERELTNDTAPVTALISRNGQYVVTFDNWHAMGDGPNTIVIYGPGGRLIRQLGLKDFLSDQEIKNLPRTVSSIWWGRDHYMVDGEDIVVLRVAEGGQDFTQGNLRYYQLRLRLADGEVLQDTKYSPK